MSDGDDPAIDRPGSDVAAAREEVIEALERSAEVYGLNRSYGRLYGILFFADDPVSLDELVERSGYAKSTVSTALRKMDRLHVVHRRSMPGEGKKAYYEAERDVWHILQELLRHEAKREISIMQGAIDSATDKLEATESEQAAGDLEKLQSLGTTYDRAERTIDVLTGTSVERLVELLSRLSNSR